VGAFVPPLLLLEELMQRSTIVSRVEAYIDRSDLTSKIQDWIDDTRLDIALKYNFRYLYVESTATTEAGTAKYALPSDYLGHLVLWCGAKKLMRVSSREFDELTKTDSEADASPRFLSTEDAITTTSIQGSPDYYVERGMEIEIYPTPDAAYTLRLKYYAQPTAWSADADDDYISIFHPEAVIWGTCLRASIYLDDDKKLATFSAAYKSALEEMVQRERESLHEDTHPRMKTYKDFELDTFKRMVRAN